MEESAQYPVWLLLQSKREHQEPLALSNAFFLQDKPWVHLHNHSYSLLPVQDARTLPSRRQCHCQGDLTHLKVTFSLSSIKITPDFVRLTPKQNYPWKERNRPEFLEKNQQPKDKMQPESLMVHGYVNGNLTKAPFLCSLSAPPTAFRSTSQELTAGMSLLILQTLLQWRLAGETLFHKVTTFDQCPNWARVKFIICLTMIPFQQAIFMNRLKPKCITTDKKAGIYPNPTFRYNCLCTEYIKIPINGNPVELIQPQTHPVLNDFFQRKVSSHLQFLSQNQELSAAPHSSST